jgi:hypothetical protein
MTQSIVGREITRATFCLFSFAPFAAALYRLLKHRREVVAIHVANGDSA